MPRNLSEVDRKKNQFDKEERVHLLAIMKRYAPLLDKSASTLARRKIWTTIEDEFKKAGFTRKTSAQLKKYWQNYKYHCKRATAFGKENKRYIDAEVSESLEWNRYQVFVDNRIATKFSEIPGIARSLTNRSQTLPLESGCRFDEPNQNDEGSTRKSNTPDTFVDLSRVKMERSNNEAAYSDCKVQETYLLENSNFQEDFQESVDEKKEIFANEDYPASSVSLVNTAECKIKNRIVVSNAKISNNSVIVSVLYPENDNAPLSEDADERTLEARLSCMSLPMRRIVADALWNDRTDTSCSLNSMKIQAANLDDRRRATVFGRRRLIEPNDSEEYRSFASGTNDDSSRERPIGEFPRQDGDLAGTDGEGNVSKSVKARNDRFEPRNYVFLTDYRNRLKHRLLLQQLETEEKRLNIKIAEMTIQEIQLRIKGLREDMRRTEELHRMRLERLANGSPSL